MSMRGKRNAMEARAVANGAGMPANTQSASAPGLEKPLARLAPHGRVPAWWETFFAKGCKSWRQVPGPFYAYNGYYVKLWSCSRHDHERTRPTCADAMPPPRVRFRKFSSPPLCDDIGIKRSIFRPGDSVYFGILHAHAVPLWYLTGQRRNAAAASYAKQRYLPYRPSRAATGGCTPVCMQRETKETVSSRK